MVSPFESQVSKGYSIEISFIHDERYHLLIKRYDKFVFEAYWIAYPSDELVLSIINGYHRNEMLNRLLTLK